MAKARAEDMLDFSKEAAELVEHPSSEKKLEEVKEHIAKMKQRKDLLEQSNHELRIAKGCLADYEEKKAAAVELLEKQFDVSYAEACDSFRSPLMAGLWH